MSCSSQMIAQGNLNRMKAEDYFDKPDQVALIKAVEREDVSEIGEAIQAGCDVNYIGSEEMTPLSWAFSKGKKLSYKELLKRGANPNFKTRQKAWNNNGNSIMQFSALSQDPYYLKLALKYGGDPNYP